MGLVNLASANSVWRGLDYYNKKKVVSWKNVGPETYDGIVSGNAKEPYVVHIDKAHPRKSHCNCPFAEGRRVICKHMIALLFTAEPEAAEEFMREVEEYEAEEERLEQQYYEDLREHISTLSKSELQEQLFQALVELKEIRDNYW